MKKLRESFLGAVVLTMVFALVFVITEPALGLAIEDQFIVSQTITSEISFATTAQDVTMTPTLGGITGGTANGTTTVVVLTNDSSGYTMTIKASSSPAMQDDTSTDSIPDYTPTAAGVPDFAFTAPGIGGEFGYTVSASTTSDLAQKFKDDGSTNCNSGSADTSGSASCWYGLSTTATSTIFRATPTSSSGSTSSVVFRTHIVSGSLYTEGIYRATTTLTATTN